VGRLELVGPRARVALAMFSVGVLVFLLVDVLGHGFEIAEDAVTEFAWIGWVALILIFVIIEMLSLEFTFLMLAVGSVIGLVSGLFGAPWWLQLLIAAVVAMLLLFTIRPPLLRLLRRGGDPTPTNVHALLGMTGAPPPQPAMRQSATRRPRGRSTAVPVTEDSAGGPWA